jgi:MFS family permease
MGKKATPPGDGNTSGGISRSSRWLRFVAELSGGRPLPRLSWREIFVAFRYRNYRLWFRGQLVSLIGTWMQTTAQGFLIYQLTSSPAYLGYVGFATGVPAWLLMLYGGVVADRLPRQKLLLATQSTMMLLALILAALTFLKQVEPWHILLLTFALGIVTAFDAPARQSFVLELVEREDLANAIALNSIMFNLATVLGPAVAGVIYAVVGPAWCFTINGLTYIAVIVALAMMRIQPIARPTQGTAFLKDLQEGLRYVAAHAEIRTLLSIVAVMSLFGNAYMTLMPAWAVKVLGGDAATNGWLLSARGLGALCGGMVIAALGRFRFKGKLLTLGTFAFPGMLLVFSAVRWLPLSLGALILVGWSFMVLFNLCNALIQTLVADKVRGRVISLYTMCIFGLMPLGALLAGLAAEVVSEPLTILLSAAIALVYALWVFLKVPGLRAQPGQD